MTLEAVMICLDNSEFARNSDYAPSRIDSQTDCANVISGAKTQQHPENVVGVATMAGERVEVLLNLTQDIGRVLSVLTQVPVGGERCDLIRSIQTCAIALKHRMNKNQKQRLVCFVASPLSATEKQLEQLGKVLKKNNVAVDVVSIGDIDGGNKAKLSKLVQSADSGGTSHFVEVEPNSGKAVADVVMTSPILVAEGSEFTGGAGGDEFGFDANMDPELAMAIRLSMEEERQRQLTAGTGNNQPELVTAAPAPAVQEEDFDAELRAALWASLHGNAEPTTEQTGPKPEDMEMDEELRKALAESMEDWEGESSAKKPKPDEQK